MLSCFSCVQLCVTPWTVARQAPLSTGFSRQEHWSGVPCPPPRGLPNPGIEPTSSVSPALAGGFFATWAAWGALLLSKPYLQLICIVVQQKPTQHCKVIILYIVYFIIENKFNKKELSEKNYVEESPHILSDRYNLPEPCSSWSWI